MAWQGSPEEGLVSAPGILSKLKILAAAAASTIRNVSQLPRKRQGYIATLAQGAQWNVMFVLGTNKETRKLEPNVPGSGGAEVVASKGEKTKLDEI